MKTKCAGGLRRQPNGPFAVLLFCEDALGTYLGVVRLAPLGNPAGGAWNLHDRYWYDQTGTDITGYRWSEDGSKLFVATSGAYGSGGAFALDLKHRKAIQLLPTGPAVSPSEPGPGFTIKDIKQR